jgi:hypothetical protein
MDVGRTACRGAGSVTHPAWNQFRVRWSRPRREVGSGNGRRDWPARRDLWRLATRLTVVVDLATNAAVAAEEDEPPAAEYDAGELPTGEACNGNAGDATEERSGFLDGAKARGHPSASCVGTDVKAALVQAFAETWPCSTVRTGAI